ncbi:MAG: hypothetical protein ACO3RV_05280, partial [Luteolibacter sp.]
EGPQANRQVADLRAEDCNIAAPCNPICRVNKLVLAVFPRARNYPSIPEQELVTNSKIAAGAAAWQLSTVFIEGHGDARKAIS